MQFLIISLYPEIFESVFTTSIIARGQKNNLLSITTKNIRDFATGKRRNVDDPPFGGGPGMLMSPQPLYEAIKWAKEKSGKNSKVIYLTPQGKTLTQNKVRQLAKNQDNLILLCGHFEGIDERIRQKYVDEEISIGDYVLTGGEIPAMVLIDAVARLIPGVIGKEASANEESFSEELYYQKEYPQYTRPANFQKLQVPKVLLSGDHHKIRQWQMANLRGLSLLEKNNLRLLTEAFPIKTKQTVIRPQIKEDTIFWFDWFNNPKITKHLRIEPPVTLEDEENFYRESKQNLRLIPLSIIDKQSKQPIGNCMLRFDQFNERSAELGLVIGNVEYHNRGIGTEVVRALIRFAFGKTDLIRIHLSVNSDNHSAKKVYEKCGFQEYGFAQKYTLKKSGFQDSHLMEIIKTEDEN